MQEKEEDRSAGSTSLASLLEDGYSDALADQGNNRTRKAEHYGAGNVSSHIFRKYDRFSRVGWEGCFILSMGTRPNLSTTKALIQLPNGQTLIQQDWMSSCFTVPKPKFEYSRGP